MLSILSRLYKYPAASAANNVVRASAAAAPFTSSSPSILPMITRDDDHEHPDDDEQQHQLYSDKNIRMEAIKSVGITQLHNATQDLILRTRQPLFEENLIDAHGRKKQSIAQIQEANRLESAIIDALAFYSSKHDTFSVGGQCIDVLGVEVAADLKVAKAYWCLPRSLDLHKIPQHKLEQLVRKVQTILDERGGKIQGLVYTRLRSCYPPRISWVAAEHVSKDLQRGVSLLPDGKRRKKWR